ncbi:hypothetical protein DL98DRAFT_278100 [Cadophora sp. DSE1049]|nr:hypothetical protein DL98DRAFT_278100 [Cadophora sp. DSE1049]
MGRRGAIDPYQLSCWACAISLPYSTFDVEIEMVGTENNAKSQGLQRTKKVEWKRTGRRVTEPKRSYSSACIACSGCGYRTGLDRTGQYRSMYVLVGIKQATQRNITHSCLNILSLVFQFFDCADSSCFFFPHTSPSLLAPKHLPANIDFISP